MRSAKWTWVLGGVTAAFGARTLVRSGCFLPGGWDLACTSAFAETGRASKAGAG